jgi:hypothetical protein
MGNNQDCGVRAMRIYLEISAAILFGGLVLWVWRYRHRKSWSLPKPDESMRRHVNLRY